MANWLVAVAAKSVLVKPAVSFKFMFDSGMPREWMDQHKGGDYGRLYLRDKGSLEFDPFKLVRGEPGAIGPNGTLKWELTMGNHGQQTAMGHVDENPPLEEGLQSLLRDFPDGYLLMEQSVLDRFLTAANLAGIETKVHRFDGELATS